MPSGTTKKKTFGLLGLSRTLEVELEAFVVQRVHLMVELNGFIVFVLNVIYGN